MSAPYVKLLRGPDTEKLLAEHPNCFLVLTLVALRARREVPQYNPHGLQKGEALVGDFAAVGLERQPFRTALANLQRWGFITTRATSKGTIAKLSKSAFYDINFSDPNQQSNQELTTNPTSNQPAANQQLTTNKNVKKERREEGRGGQPAESSFEEPNKFFPDASTVFTMAGFKAFVTKMNFGHIDRGFYLTDIQRKAEMTKGQRDETGWENFVIECLKRELKNQTLLTTELGMTALPVIAVMPEDPLDLWGFNDTPEQRALRLAAGK